ncbi:MAG: alpha/beta hydrolase [Limisphaerales bacterium]
MNRSLVPTTLALLLAAGFASAQDKAAPRTPPRLPPGQLQRIPDGVKVTRELPYAPGGHERHKLDIYTPESASAGAKLPLVVWVHGGGWQNGSKNACPALWLVPRGYVVASINYRLSSHATYPAQIEDCKAAIRWLRANAASYGIDGERIGAWGSSAGGHLVALLGVTGDVKDFDKGENLQVSSAVQAVCDFFGPTDFLQMTRFPGAIPHDSPNSPESKLIGGAIQENKDKVARANPLTFVSRADAPFLILHGDKDPVVPIHQSELLEAALKQAGVEATLVKLEGAGHGGPPFNLPEQQQRVAAFFDKHLKRAAK